MATKFDGPIKLLFPRSLDESIRPSMLGLGDIVVPGIFIAMMMRFDRRRSSNSYFFSQMILYVVGLGSTVAIMLAFQAAQPALLYLVPAALIAAFGTAWHRNELAQLIAFDGELEPPKSSAEAAKSD